MKIIISGGLGYVGGRLSDYFAEQGNEVIALSRQAKTLTSFERPARLKVVHPDDLLQTTLLNDADVFIHLAALNENDCVTYPDQAIEVNVNQTRQWLERAYQAEIKRFIYFSTAHVYGKPLIGYYDEQSLTVPAHPYSITHKCAEDYVLMYRTDKGMNTTIVRLTNSFGGPAFPTADRWTLLVNDLCRSAVNTAKMTLLSDGQQHRDFICLEDVCAGVDSLSRQEMDMNDNGIYNLGSGTSRSVWDFAQQIKMVAEKMLESTIELTRKAPQHIDERPITIGIEKLKSKGMHLKNNVEHEIASTIAYFKKYK